jgi:hypothetical protein
MLSEQHDMQNLMEVRRALEYAAAARAVVCWTEDNSASSKSLSRECNPIPASQNALSNLIWNIISCWRKPRIISYCTISSALGAERNSAVAWHYGREPILTGGKGFRRIGAIVHAPFRGENVGAIEHTLIKRGRECVDLSDAAGAAITRIVEANRTFDCVIFRQLPKRSDCLNTGRVVESGFAG